MSLENNLGNTELKGLHFPLDAGRGIITASPFADPDQLNRAFNAQDPTQNPSAFITALDGSKAPAPTLSAKDLPSIEDLLGEDLLNEDNPGEGNDLPAPRPTFGGGSPRF